MFEAVTVLEIEFSRGIIVQKPSGEQLISNCDRLENE
jgi:hypothetical protein